MSDMKTDVEPNNDERCDVEFCGVVLGTCSGWDMWNDNGMLFYEFEPAEAFKKFFNEVDSFGIDASAQVCFVFYRADEPQNGEGYQIETKAFLAKVLEQI